MTDQTTTDKLVIQYESTGAKEFADAANNAAKSIDGVVVAADKVEKSTGSVDGKFAALERRFGTAAGQASQFEKIQNTVNDALAAGRVSQERANEVLDAARTKYSVVASAEKALADAHGGVSNQAIALQHSMRSAIEQVALGASPVQALTAQMSRLAYVASGEGGISGAFGQVANTAKNSLSSILGMVTPLRLLGGVIGVTAGAALYLGHSWEESASEVDRALTGIGAKSGTTAKDIANFTKANATATGLSVSEARNVALEFTKTGEVTVGALHGVGEAIRGYSILTGKDAAEATKEFAGVLNGDMLKGILGIDERYNSLNAKSIEYIRTLIDQGDKTKALQTYIDGLKDANERAEKSVGKFAAAWQGLKNVVSNATSGPDRATPQDQLAEAQGRLSEFKAGKSPFQNEAGFGDEMEKEVAKWQKAVDSLNAQNAQAQLDALSKSATLLGNAALPQVDALRQLDEAIRKLEESQVKDVAPSNADAAISVYKQQRDLQQQSLDATVRQAQEANTLVQVYGGVTQQTAQTLNNLNLQLAVAQQVTAAGQMRAQAEATRVQLIANQGVQASQAQEIAAKQLEVSQAGATSQVLKQVDALKDSTELIKAQQNGTEATTAASIAYRNAIASGADETAAAALKAAMLANNVAQAAGAAQTFEQNIARGLQSWRNLDQGIGVSLAAASRGGGGSAPNLTGVDAWVQQQNLGNVGTGSMFKPGTMPSGPLSFSADPSVSIFYKGGGAGTRIGIGDPYADIAAAAKDKIANMSSTDFANVVLASGGSINSAISAAQSWNKSDTIQTVSSLYDLKNSQADSSTKNANLAEEMAWLRTQPQSIERDQKLSDLQQSIDQLKTSTDSLNTTNQQLLSPYYEQDPRTSHIGYRSQGMASTGYIDIPGTPSANDNMTLTLPVASGERVFVGNGPNRGGSTTNVTNHYSISVSAGKGGDANAIGRTVFQAVQAANKVQAAAG